MSKITRVVAMIGNGGRIKAIWECCKKNPKLQLVAVFSHKKYSDGLEWIKTKGVSSIYFRLDTNDLKNKRNRKRYDKILAEEVAKFYPSLIVSAGWNLVFSSVFLSSFPNKCINLHPAVLSIDSSDTVQLSDGLEIPVFRGQYAVRDTLNYFKERSEIKNPKTGATVHFIDEGIDTGRVILSTEVDILPEDTEESLRERILNKEEEKILCKAINQFADGKLYF